MVPGFHISIFRTLQTSLVCLYKADPMEVALSIFNARRAHVCGEDSWWGSYPPKAIYDKLKQKEELLQIAHQVLYFKSLYEKQLTKLAANQVLETSYKSVCNSPSGFLDEIKTCASQLGGSLTILTSSTFSMLQRIRKICTQS